MMHFSRISSCIEWGMTQVLVSEWRCTVGLTLTSDTHHIMLTANNHQPRRHRTVAIKSSIGGFGIPKFDKNSTDLQCFIFRFGEAWSFVLGRLSPPKPHRGDGTAKATAAKREVYEGLFPISKAQNISKA